MVTRKDRRHSGRIRDALVIPAKVAKEEGLDVEVLEHWSDWDDYRDGFRFCKDGTLKKNGGHKRFSRKSRS